MLVEKLELQDKFLEDQMSLLEKLMPLNIEARYPKYKDELLKSLTQEKCEVILKETKELPKWIKKRLEQH